VTFDAPNAGSRIQGSRIQGSGFENSGDEEEFAGGFAGF
jgi:hypothetical protein